MTTPILQDRFEIETQLSCTDFSTVYLGCDRKYTHAPRCLITAIPYRQREIRHRLEREAQILERLGRHTQIPKLLTYFHRAENKAEGTFYLVQDYIEGHTLSEELTNSEGLPKKLSESYVSKLLQDALSALTFAHEQGIAHQNLHPQNLVRRKQDGTIFLRGFGAIAKIARSKVSDDGTLSSSIPASPSAYVAPEQLRALSSQAESEGPQLASDLYALGLIAIEALTGQRHTEFEYEQGSGLRWRERANVNLPLAEFVDRLTRQSWQDRFPNAKEALKTLRWERDRHQVAHNSRIPTVIVAPGHRSHTSATDRMTSRFGMRSNTQALSAPQPYFYKLVAGSVAAVLALGVGVKTYQWGEYRVSQLPQTWRDWRESEKAYAVAEQSTVVPLLADGSIMLQPAAAESFWQMVAAAESEAVELYPLSGYSAEAQSQDYITGYAVDIGGVEKALDRQLEFAQTAEFRWLRRNAQEYGFELSAHKDRLLGGNFEEPWHWRYVGDEASRAALGL